MFWIWRKQESKPAADAAERLSIPEANRLAQTISDGEASIEFDGFQPVLRRKNRRIYYPLHEFELTEASLRERLKDWRNWPEDLYFPPGEEQLRPLSDREDKGRRG
jgi:hypothetical protein